MKVPLSEVAKRADAFFMGKSPIHDAMTRIAGALRASEIPFAIAGAMAVNAHGHVRTTADVDVLLTPEGLARFKEKWLGRGWVEQFPGSRGLRDAVSKVNVDVILTGHFPGDGKPKPVAFPDPATAAELDRDGLPVLTLPVLITLKLASGMTAPDRPRDLDDVIQLIRANTLDRVWGDRLDSSVRAKYLELWDAAQIEDEH